MKSVLLSLGFRYKGMVDDVAVYECEDVVVHYKDGVLYLMPLEQEVTVDELEQILING